MKPGSMVKVKICGLTSLEDALAAAELGADAVGFVFAPSPRRVSPRQVADIVSELPPFVCKVGVFVDTTIEEITATMDSCGLDMAQLHGNETPDLCKALLPRVIKSFPVKDESILSLLPRYQARAYLLDSYHDALKGGTGHSFDWEIAQQATRYGRIILSGGLTPENVRQAISRVHPYAVDVSSGVESGPGIKDRARLRAFIQAARGCDDAESQPESE